MAVGQAALAPVFDVGAADAVEARLESRELARHASHADAVRDALELHRHYDAAGMGLATPSQLALVWQCSEARATGLLNEAQVLSELPGCLPALDRGLLTVEQSRMLVDTLVGVPDAVRDEVWQRLVPQLERDRATCAARPPARLRGCCAGWCSPSILRPRLNDGAGQRRTPRSTTVGVTTGWSTCSPAAIRSTLAAAGAGRRAAVRWVRRSRAAHRCRCSFRSARPSVSAMSRPSSSGTARSSPTGYSSCSSPRLSFVRCGLTSTACRSP